MDRAKAFSFTAGCYSGEPASCTYACPFRLDLRSFLKKAAKGRWAPAYKEFRAAVHFPALVAALCPRPCEGACQWQTVLGGEAIDMGGIERAVIANTKRKEATSYAIPPKEAHIAVVGAGPAGLTAALLLAQKRFPVTVFERGEGWGGALRTHPEFALFDEEFALSFSTVEAEFRFGEEVQSLDTLAGYGAVVVATGSGGPDFGLLEGFNPALHATADERVFLCGEVTGASLMEGMAGAAGAVRSVESFVTSGSLSFAASQEEWDRTLCTRYAPHPGVENLPRVRPAGAEHTEEEAKAEAGRCLQCDCEACMEACELLVQYKKKPPRINNDIFMDGQGRNSVSSACITRQTWSCNLCGRCGKQCHTGVDLRGLFQYSREDRVQGGNYPPALHDYWLRAMAFAAGEASFAAAKEGKTCEYAFFPGCSLGGSTPAHVERAYATLRERLGAGLLLNCCGTPAWWAGDGPGFEAHIETLRKTWEKLGRPILVTACATCERMLARFLPEIKLISLYEILAEAPPAAEAPLLGAAAVFDPCAAERPGEKAAVRTLAKAGGVALTDYDSDGRCCGYGGHMQLANPKLYEEIARNRSAETGEPFIVYCANCREVFAGQGKECAHILDVVYGLEPGAVPSLEEKRQNSLRLKRKLMKEYWNEDFTPPQQPWDGLPVTVPSETAEKMERQLITLGEVRETIWRAKQAGEGFKNTRGEILTSLAGTHVTYWVLYREDETGAIEAVDVYSHRMRPKEKG